MNGTLLAAGSCFLAGMLTTIHPCPLTTNIASVSMLTGWSARVGHRRLTLLFFILGYLVSFTGIAIVLSSGVISMPGISYLLQVGLKAFLGPVLIIVGMLLADLLNLNRYFRGRILSTIKSENWSGISAFPFGAMVALSFCPATAAIFFGVLVPLSVEYNRIYLFPVLYASGASIPLVLVSVLVRRSINLGRNPLLRTYIPRVSGWVLIILGIVISVKSF